LAVAQAALARTAVEAYDRPTPMPIANLHPAHRRVLRLSPAIFLLLLAATLAQAAWYYPQLPARVASHFDMAGQVNATMPKQGFLEIHLVVIAILSTVFLVMPALIVRLPPGMVNLPNKEYWLAPERREHTMRIIQGHLVGFGDAMLLFLFVVFGDAMRASLMPEPHLSNRIWALLVMLGVFAIGWTVLFIRAFRLPEAAQ
jgi:uncharacterized membrane protein